MSEWVSMCVCVREIGGVGVSRSTEFVKEIESRVSRFSRSAQRMGEIQKEREGGRGGLSRSSHGEAS